MRTEIIRKKDDDENKWWTKIDKSVQSRDMEN
mgnify:FL=1